MNRKGEPRNCPEFPGMRLCPRRYAYGTNYDLRSYKILRNMAESSKRVVDRPDVRRAGSASGPGRGSGARPAAAVSVLSI